MEMNPKHTTMMDRVCQMNECIPEIVTATIAISVIDGGDTSAACKFRKVEKSKSRKVRNSTVPHYPCFHVKTGTVRDRRIARKVEK